MARGGVGGDYSREAINRGTAIIRGNRVGSYLLRKKKNTLYKRVVSSIQLIPYIKSAYRVCTTTLLFECLGA